MERDLERRPQAGTRSETEKPRFLHSHNIAKVRRVLPVPLSAFRGTGMHHSLQGELPRVVTAKQEIARFVVDLSTHRAKSE